MGGDIAWDRMSILDQTRALRAAMKLYDLELLDRTGCDTATALSIQSSIAEASARLRRLAFYVVDGSASGTAHPARGATAGEPSQRSKDPRTSAT